MQRRFVLTIVTALLAAILLAGCSGAVTGEVSSKSSAEPIRGAAVTVGAVTATTDSQGRFTIEEVDTGSAAVEVTADGYGPYSATIEVERGDNTLNVVLEDGTVTGVLRENAAVKEKIEKAKVTVAGEKATVNGRRFEMNDVPVGSQTIKVTAPGHETYEETVEVLPGENTVEVLLNLTPVESYTRYHEAYRFERYREAYRFVHADVKKHDDYAEFAKSMKSGPQAVDIEFFKARNLKKWRCAWAKKTYKNVAAVDRTIKYQSAYGDYEVNDTRYWQKTNGRWYIIYDWTHD